MEDPNADGAFGEAFQTPPASDTPQSIDMIEARSSQGDGPDASGDQTRSAASMADQAKQKLTGALDAQKGAAADMVENLAKSVHNSGQQFAGQQDWIASAVQRGAAELNTLASTLREKDLGELVTHTRSFARRQPALFMGAALVAGFAVARVGKLAASDLSRDDLPTMPEVVHGNE